MLLLAQKNIAAVKAILLIRNISLNANIISGHPALYIAIAVGNLEIITLLKSLGADDKATFFL